MLINSIQQAYPYFQNRDPKKKLIKRPNHWYARVENNQRYYDFSFNTISPSKKNKAQQPKSSQGAAIRLLINKSSYTLEENRQISTWPLIFNSGYDAPVTSRSGVGLTVDIFTAFRRDIKDASPWNCHNDLGQLAILLTSFLRKQ
jgi:hypothetical protein